MDRKRAFKDRFGFSSDWIGLVLQDLDRLVSQDVRINGSCKIWIFGFSSDLDRSVLLIQRCKTMLKK